jgi:hypothetical protein
VFRFIAPIDKGVEVTKMIRGAFQIHDQNLGVTNMKPLQGFQNARFKAIQTFSKTAALLFCNSAFYIPLNFQLFEHFSIK